MKKTIIASSLAVGLGVVAGNAGHDAHASEADLNKAQLAQMAQSNDQSLNESPLQEGAYNYTFDYDGFTYHFESDGQNFSWSYNESGNTNSSQQDVSAQASTATNETSATEVGTQQQANSAQPEQVSAPQTEQTQQPTTSTTSANQEQTQQPATTTTSAPASNDNASTSNNTASTSNNQSSSQASSGSSVNVNSHLQTIAQRESGGDITAINPSTGAAGKYQFLQSTWDSVAPDEYKGVSPAEAPEDVQDAAAVELYNTAGPSQWVTA